MSYISYWFGVFTRVMFVMLVPLMTGSFACLSLGATPLIAMEMTGIEPSHQLSPLLMLLGAWGLVCSKFYVIFGRLYLNFDACEQMRPAYQPADAMINNLDPLDEEELEVFQKIVEWIDSPRASNPDQQREVQHLLFLHPQIKAALEESGKLPDYLA